MAKKTSHSGLDWPDHDSWSAGRVWLCYTLFYGFMPLWLGVLAGLGFSHHHITWSDFLIHGELLIYAASLTAASTRLIASDANSMRPFASRQIFNLISHAVIVPSAAAYAIIKVLTFLNQQSEVKAPFIIWLSIAMVTISVVFSFLVFVLDHHRTAPADLEGEIKKAEVKLSEDFESLGEPEMSEPPAAGGRPEQSDEHGQR